MTYTGPVYRPPYEANSLLLQVTVGCAHNACTFCTMYRDTKFKVEPIDQIEQDLKEAARLYPNTKRVFLVNGDAFVLSARRLKPIAELIHKYLPFVEVISMYASVNNVKGKSDEELRELVKLGIRDLWVGVETGHAKTLQYLNKGFTLEEAEKQLKRLNDAGMPFYFGFMFGAAGSGLNQENAKATAKLINATNPAGVVPTTLGAFGDSPLAKEVEKGNFTPSTEIDVLDEQMKLIKLININTMYMGIHGLNTVAFDAQLPRDKEQVLTRIQNAKDNLNPSYLNSVPERHSV